MVTLQTSPPKTIFRFKSERNQKDFYDVEGFPGIRFVRSTRVLSVMANLALERWKINQNRDQVADAFMDAYKSVLCHIPESIATPEIFRETGLTILGDTRRDEVKASRAADKGTLVHKYIQTLLMREMGSPEPLPDLQEEALVGVETWKRWRQELAFKPIYTEFTVHDSEYRYAGTADLVAEIGGQPWIIDWKTTTAIYPNHKVQIASYAKAYEKMGHGKVAGGRCVLIPTPKEGKATPLFNDVACGADEIDELFTIFRACLHIYRWQTRNGQAAA